MPSMPPGVVQTSPPGRFDQYLGLDQPAGLDPAQLRVAGHLDVRAVRAGHRHRIGARRMCASTRSLSASTALVVGAHRLAHDLRRDPDHMGVADLAGLDQIDQLPAAADLALLGLEAGDRHLGYPTPPPVPGAGSRRGTGAVAQTPPARSSAAGGTALACRREQAGGDRAGVQIGDHGDPLLRPERQAGLDGVASTGTQLWVEGEGFELG